MEQVPEVRLIPSRRDLLPESAYMAALPPSVRARTVLYGTRDEWLAGRQGFLGCSEVAAVLGMSHYKSATPLAVYMRHVTPHLIDAATETDDEREAKEWGHRAERQILERYAEQLAATGHRVHREPLAVTAHPCYPLLRGTPDALVYDDVGRLVAGVDSKNLDRHRARDFGDPGSDEVPDDILLQCLGYCEVFEVDRWDVAVLFGGNRFRLYTVQRNAALYERLIQRAFQWWDAHIIDKQPPPLDATPAARALVSALYPRNERAVMLDQTEEALELAKASHTHRGLVKLHQARADAADNRLRELCVDADGIKGVATWKCSKDSEVTDWRAAFEEIAARAPKHAAKVRAKYTEVKPGARRFLLKYDGEQANNE